MAEKEIDKSKKYLFLHHNFFVLLHTRETKFEKYTKLLGTMSTFYNSVINTFTFNAQRLDYGCEVDQWDKLKKK